MPDAHRVAREIVTENLAACANIIPTVQSIYRWKEKVEEADEAMAFFKTTPERFSSLQARLKSLHPYDVPEIVALEPAAVAEAYAAWVRGETRVSP